MKIYEAKTISYDGLVFSGVGGSEPTDGLYVSKEDYDKLKLKNNQLREYSQHKEHCQNSGLLNCEDWIFRCNCGLNDLLKETK